MEARVYDADDEGFGKSGNGKRKKDREKILEMLLDGKTPQAIAEFCKYPLKLIEEVQKSMLIKR